MDFKSVSVNEFSNAFELIGKGWMLITAKKSDGKINTMTASWGGLGYMWDRNIAMCVIRPQRYTKEFVDGSDYFSLSFFAAGEHRKSLNILGTKSGRDGDKIAGTELTISDYKDITAYFNEAQTVLICKKIFNQEISKSSFADADLDKYYKNDYHTIYFGEITDVLKK